MIYLFFLFFHSMAKRICGSILFKWLLKWAVWLSPSPTSLFPLWKCILREQNPCYKTRTYPLRTAHAWHNHDLWHYGANTDDRNQKKIAEAAWIYLLGMIEIGGLQSSEKFSGLVERWKKTRSTWEDGGNSPWSGVHQKTDRATTYKSIASVANRMARVGGSSSSREITFPDFQFDGMATPW